MTLPEDVRTPVFTTKRHLWRVQYVVETSGGVRLCGVKTKQGHVLTEEDTITAVLAELEYSEECAGGTYPVYGVRVAELTECSYLGEVLNVNLGTLPYAKEGQVAEEWG